MIYVVPSAVSLRSTQISLVCSLDFSTLHSKGTTVLQELAGHDVGPLASFVTFASSRTFIGDIVSRCDTLPSEGYNEEYEVKGVAARSLVERRTTISID
jgi:hypothetical protein